MRIATSARLTKDYADEYVGHKSYFIEYKGKRAQLDSGFNDTVEVYQDKDLFYVLTKNWTLGYLGLEQFSKEMEPRGEVFFQNTGELELRKEPLEYTSPYLIKVLTEYIS